MSDPTTLSPELMVKCPFCGAPVGERCGIDSHPERVQAVAQLVSEEEAKPKTSATSARVRGKS